MYRKTHIIAFDTITVSGIHLGGVLDRMPWGKGGGELLYFISMTDSIESFPGESFPTLMRT